MNRRKFIAASAGAAGMAIAGCIELGETVDELPRPIKGDEDAPVTLEVFEDFACPACQDFITNVVPDLESEYIDEGDVQFHHYDWPIPTDNRWSYEMANAARAVQDREGEEAFFEYKELLYEDQSNISEDVLRTAAEEVGIEDVEGVLDDAANSVYQPVIDDDTEEGNQLEVEVIPTVFVNGEMMPDFSYETLTGAIDPEL